MTIVNDLVETAWGSDIGPTSADCPVQCQTGQCYVNWEGSAPSDKTDGHLLGSGDSIVLPAGTTFRLAAANGSNPRVHYEEF